MIEQASEIDSTDFLAGARIDRARRREERDLARAEALAALHLCRDLFLDDADSAAAERDSDRLERLAERLVDWSGDLKRDLERLELGCDRSSYRGAVLVHLQSPLNVGALAESLAERLCEDALGAHAGAVLRAAVRLATI